MSKCYMQARVVIALGLVATLIVAGSLLSGCGALGDPIDDMYTQDITPGTANEYSIGSEESPYLESWVTTTHGSLEREGPMGSGGYWHEYNVGASSISKGGSGATLINPNISTLGGYRLDDITEALYFTTHIEDDWDGFTRAIVEIAFEVNVDNTAGLDTDAVQFQVECWHKYPGEYGNGVNSHEGNTVIGKSDQHQLFVQEMPIHDIGTDQVITMRINLNTITSDITNVIVNYVEFKYQTKTPTKEVN